MTKSNKFSPEVRERAVRMVQEHRGEYASVGAAIESIAPKIGCVPQTLPEWVKQAQVDAGNRPGTTKPIGYIPPAEAEADYWRQQQGPATTTRGATRSDAEKVEP